MSESAPKRRPFRFVFRLRTLIILMTLVCVILGWQANIVLGRTALRRQLVYDGAAVMTGNVWKAQHRLPSVPGMAEVPLVRKLLGDESIASIGLTKPTAELLARVKAVFPEARCYVLERIFTLQIAGNASMLVLSR